MPRTVTVAAIAAPLAVATDRVSDRTTAPAHSLRLHSISTEKKMGAVTHRRRLLRRGLRRRTPGSQLNRAAAAVAASSNSESPAAAPALEWPGRETRCEAEWWNDLRLEVLLPDLPDFGRALLNCDGADHPCELLICAVCARAYRQGPQLHASSMGAVRKQLARLRFPAVQRRCDGVHCHKRIIGFWTREPQHEQKTAVQGRSGIQAEWSPARRRDSYRAAATRLAAPHPCP